MIRKASTYAAMLALLVALSATDLVADEAADLFKISKPLNIVYERDGLDLGRYNKVLLATLGLEHARVVPPPWVEGDSRQSQEWQLDDADTAWLTHAYFTAMQEQIEKIGGYPLVEDSADDALILGVEIVSLTPYALPGEEVLTKGTGTLIMQATLRDSITGELLAIYEGEQDVGTEYVPANRISAEHNANELFNAWGTKVRLIMDDSRGAG
ncbi:MAG: DUF3313 family protein [Gammaproteobacteria bacterium]|nr:DUF3313 family protein [Gammaproteobacteria bacterium]